MGENTNRRRIQRRKFCMVIHSFLVCLGFSAVETSFKTDLVVVLELAVYAKNLPSTEDIYMIYINRKVIHQHSVDGDGQRR